MLFKIPLISGSIIKFINFFCAKTDLYEYLPLSILYFIYKNMYLYPSVSKRTVATSEWRKLHKQYSFDLYSPPNIFLVIKFKINEMGGSCGTNGWDGFFVGKHEKNKPLGCPRRRWEDNIEMDVQELGWGGIDWIDLAQDRDK